MNEVARPTGVRAPALAAAAAFTFVPMAAHAQALPYLPAGDDRLRHEVQLAVDAGEAPLATTWPIPTLDFSEQARGELRSRIAPGDGKDAGWFVNGGAKPTQLRTFADTPRENGEIGLQAGWAAGDYAGGTLRFSYAFDPEDGRHIRADDTYAAWRLGNWWLSAGFQQRWWGPGHDGSLVLSNNARPLPQVAIERARALAPKSKWLAWIGPYRWTTFMGRFTADRDDVPHPYLWGLRLTVRPFDSGLELGFSRTAQWCRPGVCGLGAFKDVVLGRDNRGENVTASNEPGNQLAGFDVRYRIPSLPVAVYYQQNGESIDNNNWRPRILTQLAGAEIWGGTRGSASWRAFLEYAGTTCGEWGGDALRFGCAYENNLFTDGYRDRGRVLGHPADRDARLYTLGGTYAEAGGRSWELRIRRGELNRGGITSPTYGGPSVASDLDNVEVRVTGSFAQRFDYSLGLGYDRLRPTNASSTSSGRAFLSVSAPWGR